MRIRYIVPGLIFFSEEQNFILFHLINLTLTCAIQVILFINGRLSYEFTIINLDHI